jgi:hypothetical protein
MFDLPSALDSDLFGLEFGLVALGPAVLAALGLAALGLAALGLAPRGLASLLMRCTRHSEVICVYRLLSLSKPTQGKLEVSYQSYRLSSHHIGY